MSQAEVYSLMKDKKWHTLEELCNKFGKNKITICRNMMRLSSSVIIETQRQKVGVKTSVFIYRLKGVRKNEYAYSDNAEP